MPKTNVALAVCAYNPEILGFRDAAAVRRGEGGGKRVKMHTQNLIGTRAI